MTMYLREMGYEDGMWKETAQDCVQWEALLNAMLNLQFLIVKNKLGQLTSSCNTMKMMWQSVNDAHKEQVW